MKRSVWFAAGFGIVVSVIAVFLLMPDDRVVPLSEDQVELTTVVEGKTFKITYDGLAYRVDERTGRWHRHGTVFEPDAMNAAYQTEGSDVFRVNRENGQRHKVRRRFTEGFEDLPLHVSGLRKLIGPERGWGSLTLQSPAAPTVSDYVRLRKRILEENGSFLDAVVAPDDSRAHSGTMSLLCKAPPCPSDMITCKASLSSPLVYFGQGDEFWFRGWFYPENGRPSSLMDLECEWLSQHGGIRLFIDESGSMLAELKAWDKPKYRQTKDSEVLFPLDRWVEVKAHFHLSHGSDGVVQVWQDGKLIIDANGTTLPLARVIYSSLEIGISSHSYGDKEARLWVDDVEVSDERIAD